MARASLNNEEIARALATLGDCTCPLVGELAKAGAQFSCRTHGRGVVTSIEITSFGDKQQEMILTIRFY